MRLPSLTPALQTFPKPSGLKPPSKLPSLFKEDPTSPTGIPRATGLTELSDAMQNSRGGLGALSYGSVKHKPSGRKRILRFLPVCTLDI